MVILASDGQWLECEVLRRLAGLKVEVGLEEVVGIQRRHSCLSFPLARVGVGADAHREV